MFLLERFSLFRHPVYLVGLLGKQNLFETSSKIHEIISWSGKENPETLFDKFVVSVRSKKEKKCGDSQCEYQSLVCGNVASYHIYTRYDMIINYNTGYSDTYTRHYLTPSHQKCYNE